MHKMKNKKFIIEAFSLWGFRLWKVWQIRCSFFLNKLCIVLISIVILNMKLLCVILNTNLKQNRIKPAYMITPGLSLNICIYFKLVSQWFGLCLDIMSKQVLYVHLIRLLFLWIESAVIYQSYHLLFLCMSTFDLSLL